MSGGKDMSIALTWLGHAAFRVEIGDCKILVDPYLKGNPTATVKPDEVETDYIWVTHGHGDHIGDTVEIGRRTGATVIANSEISSWLGNQRVNTHAQHIGGGFHYPFGYLKLTLALHGSSLPDKSYGGNPAGFLLTTKDYERLYLAGDTGLFGDMALIGEEGIDLAVLPIGDNFTMGPVDALRAVKLIKPKYVIPIHFDTWDVIRQDAEQWVKAVNSETRTKAVLLKPGESFSF